MAAPNRRVGDYDRTFGQKLDEIDGQEVTLHAFNIQKRVLNGEDRDFTTVEVSAKPDGPTFVLHTWSDSIAEKLGPIPPDDLPLQAKFAKVKTTAGFEVWDVN